MKKADDLLKKIYDRVLSLDPPVKKIAVDSCDMEMNMLFLNLDRVCYITTRSDTGRSELMFVTDDGERYYSSRTFKIVCDGLIDHPHFLQTSRFYVINLTKIRGMSFSSARDLWFEGSKEPVKNAVTASFSDVFDERFNQV